MYFYLLVRVTIAGESSGLNTAANISLLAERDQVGVRVLSDGAGRHLGRADLVGDPGEDTLDTGACSKHHIGGGYDQEVCLKSSL